MRVESFMPLLGEAMRAFTPFYQEKMGQAIEDAGAPEAWFGLSLARGADPAPLTVERYHALYPYSARPQFVENLEAMVGLDLLERVGPEAYRLAGPGRMAVESIFGAAHECMAPLMPLPTEDIDRLNGLLYRLVEATLTAEEPEDKWAITYSRWTDPGEDAPPSVKTDQYLTDLLRFRDDAHLAAWKPYGVSGPAWEALTFIWRDEAHTAEALAEKLPFRSHSVEDYQEALAELETRGWAVEEAGEYRLTEEGLQVRDEAEEATDRLYFGPWSALGEGEREDLHDLLTRLRDGLQQMAEGEDTDLHSLMTRRRGSRDQTSEAA